MRTAAHRDTPGGPVFLCLWANMWSESVQPYPTSRNCHENGRTESDNADFHGHKSALILRAACALEQTKKRLVGGKEICVIIGATEKPLPGRPFCGRRRTFYEDNSLLYNMKTMGSWTNRRRNFWFHDASHRTVLDAELGPVNHCHSAIYGPF